ncbi:hypothetical protein [Teredinibacter sp. KSP-S5-2]|uniref:hypothetical protein n=1 Tax=Teredinibacter sp. KSP-S5-2 TaxID=3034506 RepID=UPI002934E7A6|nr:hypothetical protein [Teredinibacter sp. KSP-S5-2]WNO10374.1 hypothetical protein P5V12_04245 [Teredinibacter sp. KSP-S5-2]
MFRIELFLSELIAAILVGTIPCFLITLGGGLDSTVDFLESIDISDFSMNYALALYLASLVVVYCSRYIPRSNDHATFRVLLYREIFKKSGSVLASIFRLLTGVLVALGIISALHLPEAGWELTLVCFVLCLFFWVAASFFEYISSVAQGVEHRLPT